MKITLIGLGNEASDLSVCALDKINNSKKIFLRTALSNTGKAIIDRGINAVALDYLYESSKNFDQLSKRLARTVLEASKGEDVVYLVDGAVSDDVSCSIILKKKKRCEIIAGVSKASYYLSKMGITGAFSACSSYHLKDFKPTLPLVVYDIDNPMTASEVKLYLTNLFGDEIPAYKFNNGKKRKIMLYELDRGSDYNYTTAVVIDRLPLTQKTRFNLDDLHEIVTVLRSENGCPWDRAQTKESIRKDIIEEAYELVDAVNRNDEDGMQEESGDLILQSVFQSIFAEERHAFTLGDVLSGVCSKLIERHTHIFGNDKATSAESALSVWEKNKQKEKGFSSYTEYLESVPINLPALMRAQKVGSRAKKCNMDFDSALSVFEKVKEELDEAFAELKRGDGKALYEEIGDLLFAIVSLARLLDLESEEILNSATDKFIARFKKTEELILKDGKDMKSLTPEEIDGYYNASKKN